MRGETLYPLNHLRTAHPDVYEQECRKYAGREELLELRIPTLDVVWSDAVHLSPLHPRRLAAAWRAAGLWSPVWERDFFRIPVERIEVDRAVWFGSGVLPLADVVPFDPNAYRELEQPPPAYVDFLRRAGERVRPPRPFAHIPHVLVAAPVDVGDARTVRTDDPE